jgi:hypothetical protein
LATRANYSPPTSDAWQGTIRAMYNSQQEQIRGLKSMMERNENEVRDEVRSLKEMIEKLLKEKNSPDNTRKV